MSESIKTQIIALEEHLRQAMLASDIKILNELLAPEIIITTHLGELLGKEDDLAAHQSGAFKIQELNPTEEHIQVYPSMAIVSVRMQLSGSYNDLPTNGNFRYTRVWHLTQPNQWQIVAAHISMLA